MSTRSIMVDPSSELSFTELARRIAELRNELIVQTGRNDFARADALMRLGEIELERVELETLAIKLKSLEIDIQLFALRNVSNPSVINLEK
jgi:hypothetical protein